MPKNINPSVSVILPTRDRAYLLIEALKSLSAQSLDDFEVIIVDDGSTNPVTVIHDKYPFPIKLFRLKNSQGPSIARNVGINASAGDFIAFLDDDDVYSNTHLNTAVNALERSDAALYHSSSLPNSIKFNYESTHDKDIILFVNHITTSSIVLRRDALQGILFDSRFGFCEDWDFLIHFTNHSSETTYWHSDVTAHYQDIAGESRLSSIAMSGYPTEFSKARKKMYQKWPSPDPLINEIRLALMRFEAIRNHLIYNGYCFDLRIYSAILDLVMNRYFLQKAPSTTEIRELFHTFCGDGAVKATAK